MEYSKIVAVTGLPGLYELISSKTDGAIVRSLDDKSTKFISSRIHKLTQLETIEVFTVKDNVNLIEVFKAMESAGEKLPDEKDNASFARYFEKAFPDLDFEKVYASDMKKMIKWYSILKDNDIALKLSEAGVEEPVADEPAKAEIPLEVQPKEANSPMTNTGKKKAAAKKKKTEPEEKNKTKKAAAKPKSKK